jgi:hypothetical protein
MLKQYNYKKKIEDNLHDPDFVKSYEDSKRKRRLGEDFVPMRQREIVANSIHTKIRY